MFFKRASRRDQVVVSKKLKIADVKGDFMTTPEYPVFNNRDKKFTWDLRLGTKSFLRKKIFLISPILVPVTIPEN